MIARVHALATLTFDSHYARSAGMKANMLWRSPAPVRHPPGFIEPCLPTLGHAVPGGRLLGFHFALSRAAFS